MRSTGSSTRVLRWVAIAVVVAVAAFGLVAAPAGATPTGPKVLIMTESVNGGASSVEATTLSAQGFTVELLPGAQWASKSTAYFSEFRALVIGDTGSTPAAVYDTYLESSKSLWSPAITGNVFIAGADPVEPPWV